MNLTQILAPLFLCVLAGVALGRWRKLSPQPIVTAVMDLFMPALVFDALLTSSISPADMLAAGLASSLVIALLFALCVLVRPILGLPLRSFALPVLFMNAGFLGMPLMDLAFGHAGLGRIVVFDQVQSLFMFSLGIWIASGRASLRESLTAFLREPLIYAIALAILIRAAGITLPQILVGSIRFLGSVTPPLALFSLGLRLADTPLTWMADRTILKNLAAILALRFIGGFACGWAAVECLSLDGLNRQVVLIASGLPSAVFSYILAERYRAEPDLTAAAVFSSTVLSIALLPLLLQIVS